MLLLGQLGVLPVSLFWSSIASSWWGLMDSACGASTGLVGLAVGGQLASVHEHLAGHTLAAEREQTPRVRRPDAGEHVVRLVARLCHEVSVTIEG